MLGDEPSGEDERHLREIEERVRKVRHLEAFDYSDRDDGRFSLKLTRPPRELSDEDRETIARLLSKLAEEIRSS